MITVMKVLGITFAVIIIATVTVVLLNLIVKLFGIILIGCLMLLILFVCIYVVIMDD